MNILCFILLYFNKYNNCISILNNLVFRYKNKDETILSTFKVPRCVP